MEPSDDSCHSSTSRQESLNGICDVAKAIEYEWNRVVQPTGSKTSTVYTASGGVLRMVKAKEAEMLPELDSVRRWA